MKVGIFTDTFLPQKNGVVTSICELTKALKKKNVDVIIFAPGKSTKKEEWLGTKVYRIKSYPFIFYPGMYVAGLDLIKICDDLIKEDIDIFYVQDPFPIGFLGKYFAKKTKKPMIGILHTRYDEYAPHVFKGVPKKMVMFFLNKPSWSYLKTFYMEFDRIIAPTEEIKKLLIKNGFKRIEVLPSGIDVSRFRSYKIKNIREKMNIPKNAFVFLYFGRVSFEKRMEILLNAFKKIEEENIYLLIAGTGPDLNRCKKLSKRLEIKNIRFAGFVRDEDVASFYHSCDAFVSASDTETQGLVFIEAMACGLPVIGSNIGGSKEMVKDGKNGFLFNAGDAEDLAKKMRMIMDEKTRRKLIDYLPRYVSKFDPERIAEKFLKICKKLKNK
ncbi:MAG: glycosyltransferase [Candidatus Parvarchaeota archaeon]|nr:glycosyltransferase [Candidatus Jingweiarchaeum tengchongense]MCW1300090.1 glycosyltransferase [Candidatus Jingweiarchaeum tengchongense]MCW1304444.1 glycosyltransferase [Candidatus Jingweiarchaeum tengchongense]MCW1305611.1 glycosyltransferase [Candidatus Jingweiarchaeum tengchongense]MCW1309268.1 glycosyltransferase [Candidatus Jingweiarchaeum tengchongense]